MKNAYYLSAGTGELSPAVTLGQGLPADRDGQPVRHYWADAIREGEYVHPVKKFRLNVDRQRMDGWVETFRKMKAGGVDVGVNADHSTNARDSLGVVVDMKRDGGTLKVLHQLIGDDAIRMAARNKVSLGIDPDFTDGKGVRYGDAVVHSALTPVPVVPGQAGLIAASRGQNDQAFDVLELAATPLTGEQPMADLSKIREALGAAADVTEAQLIQQAAERLGSQKSENGTLLSRATAAEQKLADAESKIATLSRQPAQPDPEVYADRNEAKRERIELSRDSGDLPKSIADELLATLPAGKPNVFMLSRADGLATKDGAVTTPVDFILGLFKGKKLGIATGSQTGIQNLSRTVPGGETDEAAKAEQKSADDEVSRIKESKGFK